MRRILLLCRLGLAGVATVAVLTACGGSGGSNTASSTSSAATTTAASAAPVAGGTFCSQARNFAAQVAGAAGSLTQQGANTGQVMQQLLAQLQTITPPPEIASDWRSALSDLQQMAQVFSSTNLSDPQAAAQLQQKIGPLEQSLTGSGQRIDTYLRTKCGIDTGDTGSPTS